MPTSEPDSNEASPVQTKPEPARPEPIIPLLPYQYEELEANDRFRWNCWARQTGKSFTKTLRRITRGFERRRDQIFLSAGERQCRELMHKARMHCMALKIAMDFETPGSRWDVTFKQLEIKLPNGIRIIGLPANPQTVRGYTGDVFLDEFAMHSEDREVWAAIFPTILHDDGELDIASTPRGKSNVFYDLRDNEKFAKSHLTIFDAVEQGLDVNPEEIRQAIGDEATFRQEFLCEFIDESTAFLSYEQIAACTDSKISLPDCPEDLNYDKRELFAGVDVGRVHDLTVVWVFALDGDTLVTAAVFELSNQPFLKQYMLLKTILLNKNLRMLAIDATGLGMQLAEHTANRFGEHRVDRIAFTPSLKNQIAGELRVAIEKEKIRIPDDAAIRDDWHSVRRRISPSGNFALDAPRSRGGHADRFWAAALAVHAAATAQGPTESSNADPIQFARHGTW